MWCKITGSQNNLSGFLHSFLVETDLNLSNSFSIKADVRIPADPDGYGVFDPHLILRDYVPNASGSFDFTEYGVNRETSFLRYLIQYAPFQNGTQLDNYGYVFSGFCHLGSIQTTDFATFDSTDYILGPTSKLWLTNAPHSLSRQKKVYAGQYEWFHFIQNTGSFQYIDIFTCSDTDENNALGHYRIANPYSDTTQYNNHYLRVAVGPAQLALIPSGSVTVVSGTYPIWTSQVKSYTVTAINLPVAAPLLDQLHFVVEDDNCKYGNIRLHFRNRHGFWDSANFPLVSRKKIDIERRSYLQKLGRHIGNTYGYTKQDRGKTDFYVKSEETLTVTSDWLTTEESAWMEELFTSPNVFMQTDDSTVIPMNVKLTGTEIKETENEELINYEIELSYANINER